MNFCAAGAMTPPRLMGTALTGPGVDRGTHILGLAGQFGAQRLFVVEHTGIASELPQLRFATVASGKHEWLPLVKRAAKISAFSVRKVESRTLRQLQRN